MGKADRSLSQPTAVSSLYAREPLCRPFDFTIQRGPALTFRGPLHTRQGFALPPSPSRRGRGALVFYSTVVTSVTVLAMVLNTL